MCGWRESCVRRASRRVLGSLAIVVGLAALVPLCYYTVPQGNTDLTHFDTLLILGVPARAQGGVSLEERWRVDEAAREFRAGRAEHLLFSGGASYNRWVEADAMAEYAETLGVPAGAILREPASVDTLSNVKESERLLEEHGWRSVEVVTSPEHMPRAALFMARTHLLWRMHGAPTPGQQIVTYRRRLVEEAVATTILRLGGSRMVSWMHRVKMRFNVM